MKTDRELLELAAKAAEYDYWPDGYDDELTEPCIIDGQFPKPWNPLTDDGDALRLAVKLRIIVDITPWAADAHHWQDKRSDDYGIRHTEFEDPCAATRRAIVRAAAAIGEGMQ